MTALVQGGSTSMRTAINAQSPSARTSGVTPDDGRRQIASPVDRNSFRSPCGERERDCACPRRFNLYENRYNLVERHAQSTGVRSHRRWLPRSEGVSSSWGQSMARCPRSRDVSHRYVQARRPCVWESALFQRSSITAPQHIVAPARSAHSLLQARLPLVRAASPLNG